MIYKFKSSNGAMEIEIEKALPKEITLTIQDINTEKFINIDLHQSEIYDLIGCLHSLQAKIKKEVNNG